MSWTTPARTSPTARRYDLILDIAGNTPLTRLRSALAPTGTLVIEYQDPVRRWRLLDSASHVVDDRGQRAGRRHPLMRVQQGWVEVESGSSKRSGQVAEQAWQVVVVLVERQPPD